MKTNYFRLENQGRMTPVELGALGPNTIVFVKNMGQMDDVSSQVCEGVSIHAVGSILGANTVMNTVYYDSDTTVVYHISLLASL